MRDIDYGTANNIWNTANRGTASYSTPTQSPSYNYSERLAVKNGFEAVEDSSAYNGRYFIKNAKLWIHNINALRTQLYKSDSQLVAMGYDVEIYYATHKAS